MTDSKTLDECVEPLVEEIPSDRPSEINNPLVLTYPHNSKKVPLFDSFFIITADKSDCYKLFSNIGDTMSLDPKILYSFPAYKSDQTYIPKFVFPFGVTVQKIKKTKSFSQINEIIFGQSIYDKYLNSFIFAIRNDESYIPTPKNASLLQLCNPDKL